MKVFVFTNFNNTIREMNVNEIKLEIKDQISEIEKYLPGNQKKSFHHELMSDSVLS